jgi:phosphatidylinositol-3-phosphatase
VVRTDASPLTTRHRPVRRALLGVAVVVAALSPAVAAGAAGRSTPTAPSLADPAAMGLPAAVPAAASVPRFDHIVLVMFENRAFSQIDGSASAPYLNSLAGQGAKLSKSFAITHPSQPNYIALFSGSTQGVTNDDCPKSFTGANLGAQLTGAGLSFAGYSETMPTAGFTGCTSGNYARKHNSWVDFSSTPASANLTFAAFPTDFTRLPTVAFVSPDLCSDMHDCSIGTGDTWQRDHLNAYAQWAKAHNSLLIVTFDEDNRAAMNQIYTLFVGAHVTPGTYPEQINHYSVLRTIEASYGLAGINNAASSAPITDVFS